MNSNTTHACFKQQVYDETVELSSSSAWEYEVISCFFFFKQKTAYEFASCLVGSEMCIRDSVRLPGYLYNGSVIRAAMVKVKHQ